MKNVFMLGLKRHVPSVAAVAALATLLSLLAAPLAHAQGDVIPLMSTTTSAVDTTPPSDVENVKAVPGKSQVTLTWNVAVDNKAVKGYRVYYGTKSVVKDGDKYDFGPVDAGNKINYTLSGLTSGIPYYFAVTAYDEAGNESDKYSSEVSATPLLGAADSEAPKVVKAEASSMNDVKVTFSEGVTLPVLDPKGAFSIKNDATQVALEVTGASIDATDTSKKTVLLKTSKQEAGVNYIVTAGIQVKDSSGNPVKSGTSDTALFVGSDKAPVVQTQQPASGDTIPPELVSVTAPDDTHVVITFSEALKPGADSPLNYVITEETNIDKVLEISAASLSADMKTVTLTTATQKAINYNLIVLDVSDSAGNLISTETNAAVFFGGATVAATQETMETQETVEDIIPPEDVTQFMAALLGKMMVHLSWIGSINSASDLANYVLYMSTDGKEYGEGVILNPDASTFDVANVVPGMKYFFKLTAKDDAGNESQGVVSTMTLPGTGPELGLLLLGSLGLGKFFTRKKKK